MRKTFSCLGVLLLTFATTTSTTCSRVAEAADVKDAKNEDPKLAHAREEFIRGIGHIKDLQYSDALAAFERSASQRPHAVTTYNIGACLRAMGQYTLAQRRLNEALKQAAEPGGGELSESYKVEAKGFIADIDRLLARVDVTLTPVEAAITVDGRPLEIISGAATGGPNAAPVLIAGTRPPGPGEAPPQSKFSLVMDPGSHVLILSRKGFADSVVNKVFAPGTKTTLDLKLDRLPATLHFTSNQDGAVVSVNALDVGVAPVDISRPTGHYRVVVRKPGYLAYETEVDAHPGERVDLTATLKEDRPSLTQRWWFWTAAGVLLAGVAAGTYFITRPEPERPPLNGGGLGWTLETR